MRRYKRPDTPLEIRQEDRSGQRDQWAPGKQLEIAGESGKSICWDRSRRRVPLNQGQEAKKRELINSENSRSQSFVKEW